MFSRIFYCSLLIAFMSPAATSQPSIVVSDSSFGFGVLYEGMIQTRVLKLYNTGTTPLKILQLNAPCHCSTLSMDTDVILPKDSADLRITFNSKTYNGDVQKNVLVVSNDPAHRNSFITFHADVRAILKITPPALFFSLAKSGPVSERKIDIQNLWNKPVTIDSSADSLGFVSGFPKHATIQPGDTLHAIVSAAKYHGDEISGYVNIFTDCTWQKVLRVNYFMRGGK
ncbi:MAG: DUF1573 domain-containing protein [Bacteroidota bacterium]